MSKNFKLVLIVFLSCLLLLFTCGFIILLNNNNFSGFTFNVNFSESSKLIFDKEYGNDYSNIKVVSTVSDVKFIKTESDNFSVKLYAEEENISVEDNNSELVIKYEQEKKNSLFNFGAKTPIIEVYVPSNYIGSFDVDSRVGDVKVESFDASVLVKLNTGDIKVDNVKSIDAVTNTGDIKVGNAKDLKLVSTTGDIKVSSANNLFINTKTGDIKVGSVNGNITASTSTGDVYVEKLVINKNSSLNSNVGDITVNSTNEIYIDAKTNTGDTDINNNYKDAKYELKVKTNTGDIEVNN